MRIMLEEDLSPATSLVDVGARALDSLAYASQYVRIEHLAGPISADGEEHIQRNIGRLLSARQRLQRESPDGTWVLTAPLVFTPELYRNLEVFKMPRAQRELELRQFWRTVVGSGLLACLHVVHGWQRSSGTVDEHTTALLSGVPIRYLDESY